MPSKKIKKEAGNKKEPGLNLASFLQEFTKALLIVSVIILLTISFVIVGQQKKPSAVSPSNLAKNYLNILAEINIVDRGQNFFGSLNSLNLSHQNSDDGSRLSAEMSGQGSSGSSFGLAAEQAMVGQLVDSKMLLPAPNAARYNYVYSGGDFSLFPESVKVYRRLSLDLSQESGRILKNEEVPFFDLNRFDDLSVNNLTLFENRPYGYSLYLGLKDGQFSIYKDWNNWPVSNNGLACLDDGLCYEENGFRLEDVLSDDEILKISDQFLSDYNIDLDAYGPGQPQKLWLKQYLLSSSSWSLPQSISVIYPLLINGQEVYEEYGNKVGLSVELDMKEKRVSSVYNLSYQYYESSDYDSERDQAAIIKLAEAGGLSRDYYYGDQTETVNIKLGQAKLGLVKIWQYNQESYESYELYVPAYIFPIISESSTFYRENIIVPAVKDFYRTSPDLPLIMEGVEAAINFRAE